MRFVQREWSMPGRALLTSEEWRVIQKRLGLSRRQLQIAQAVFDNATEQRIALELGVSVNTVHTHFLRLYKRLGVTTRVELVLSMFDALLARTGQAWPPSSAPAPPTPQGHVTSTGDARSRCAP